MKCPLLLALLLLAATAASAQTVYRCGPDGSEYRQTPCPGGQAVNVADPRTDAQRSEAAQRAQRDAELAQGLRQQQAPASARAAAATPAHLAKPAAQPTSAEHKVADARHHGKRHRALPENARIARAPAEPKPAKPPKAAKPADVQP